ncbi:helix-turn-helix domain-containing protein [Limosilactobacillus reuteri]|uniref:helix-turn-helix domain-containing protein n=1 Tax=Limosilactobacillus reuteri TaxID=1598 RepID=UPI003D81633B
MEQQLGKNIANRRHELNMTQQQLAKLSNLSINFISRLERGGSNDVSSTTF